jgi:hypothetical protein
MSTPNARMRRDVRHISPAMLVMQKIFGGNNTPLAGQFGYRSRVRGVKRKLSYAHGSNSAVLPKPGWKFVTLMSCGRPHVAKVRA